VIGAGRPEKTGLRSGWTTGSCATAAAKAAALTLLTGQPVTQVVITLPAGQRVGFAVVDCALLPDPSATSATATVIKDAGDDPDVTHQARIVATVSRQAEAGVIIEGGPGVGMVTLPGLGLEVGKAAINPVPRKMIVAAVSEILRERPGSGLRVVISVPGGEKLAQRTLNPRLGIVGGISILGTTGIVRPMSTESWRASVEQAVAVAAACRARTLVLCTGGRSERAAMTRYPELAAQAFVEVGDFTGAAITAAAPHSFARLVFVGMVGKLTKLAGGILMTHADQAAQDLAPLVEITKAITDQPALTDAVRQAHTARHVHELWQEAGLLPQGAAALCAQVARLLRRTSAASGGPTEVEVVMVDFAGEQVIGTAQLTGQES
jgi:cobalt-precorrin-5B (C1)-methyltransferase